MVGEETSGRMRRRATQLGVGDRNVNMRGWREEGQWKERSERTEKLKG